MVLSKCSRQNIDDIFSSENRVLNFMQIIFLGASMYKMSNSVLFFVFVTN